ncbi:MAG: ribonuclease III [Lachnospiraceae bacterium]|nr:ribonuclease III [Lachnospiraceae bacterium]
MNGYDFSELENKIGYVYKNKQLLKQAMTHTSFANEQKINKLDSYERIEFLGDAVLEMVSSEYFYFEHPKTSEGNLTKMRASAVCEPSLAITARQLELGKYLLLGKGEEATGGRERDSIIADAVEALIGSIYLDGGLAEAKRFILKFVLNDLEHKQLFYDAKSILMETLQAKKLSDFEYRLVGEEGPDHEKLFKTEAVLSGECIGYGEGQSKKISEQKAAYEALMTLRREHK